MIKIYFDETPLYLVTNPTVELSQNPELITREGTEDAINKCVEALKKKKSTGVVLVANQLEQLQKEVWKRFTIVQAAGGVVENDSGSILMMFRRNTWDLPKGKLDDDESLETCAEREIKEETGLTNVVLERFLIQTYHTYPENKHYVLKETSWYKFHAPGDQPLHPQADEQIAELVWAQPHDLSKYLSNTFPSIQDVLGAAQYI